MIGIKKIAVSKKSGTNIYNNNYNSISDGWRFAFSEDGQTINDNGKRFVGFYKGQKKPTEFDSYVWVKALPKLVEISQNYNLTGDEDILYLTTDGLKLMTTYTPYDGQELKIIATDTYILDGVEYKGKNFLIWYNGQWH